MEKSPEGYSRLAAFLSSDRGFSIYRGFDYLHARVILNLQDQIVSLERELDMKDSLDQKNNLTSLLKSRARDARSSSDNGEERSRQQILEDIRKSIVNYGSY